MSTFWGSLTLCVMRKTFRIVLMNILINLINIPLLIETYTIGFLKAKGFHYSDEIDFALILIKVA